jgi:hypothetical protein
MNPHFYRLRKGTVGKDLGARKGDGENAKETL